MKNRRVVKITMAVALGIAGLSCQAETRARDDQLCLPLKAFIASVQRGETRKLDFHTSWGSGFKDSTLPNTAIFAKRCEVSGYAPGEAVCDYLMKHGAVEFAGNNAIGAIACLSPGTRFAQGIRLDRVDVSFAYGSERHGSNVTILFDEDNKLGGMVLRITADGY